MEKGKTKAARKRVQARLTVEQKVESLDIIYRKTSYKPFSEKY